LFKPLLCPLEDPLSTPDYFQRITFPALVSPKIDGIRGVVKAGKVQSRSFKPHRNLQVQEDFSVCEHVDMELTFGAPVGPDVMNRAQSAVRSKDTRGEFCAWAFDYTEDLRAPYFERLEMLREAILDFPQYNFLEHKEVTSLEELLAYEDECLFVGYEGVIVRNPMAPYKCGRATMNDEIIWRVKRFTDFEATCIGFTEAMHNANEEKYNELGYMDRSTHKDNKLPMGMAGAYLVKDESGYEFTASAGKLSHDERKAHFEHPELVLGQTMTVRAFGKTPAGAWRFPRVVSLRYDI